MHQQININIYSYSPPFTKQAEGEGEEVFILIGWNENRV